MNRPDDNQTTANTSELPLLDRRAFLKGGAAVATFTLAPGIILYTTAEARNIDERATDKVRWAMLIDSTLCEQGCSECVTACQDENGWGSNEIKSRPSQQAQWIRKVELKNSETGMLHSLPMMCQHCANPPCVDVCPTTASFKRADGIVLVDRHLCIGCRFCMMACPYKARSFVHETLTNQKSNAPRGKGCVEACTLCVHKLDAGDGTTACAQACSKGAILVGDLKDQNSELAKRVSKYATTQIRADLGLNTGVRYQGI
ncbi:MAG: 4Fe-4S dicluster domain-containing protein [Gammaproteobacteria bacterium]|nr:4Fe-4S dicluster domain-containing protein [Gammaproteobacteria bacterium]